MLTLRRVPTLLSVNQDEEKAKLCEKSCLGAACSLGCCEIPLYSFARRYSIKSKRLQSFSDLHSVPDINDLNSSSSEAGSDEEQDRSFLDTLLLAQWEDRAERGLFRYDVTACETKVLSGDYGFIAQFNEGRHLKKRATEFRIDQVLQDFDSKKFNFTKVAMEEVLFRFEESEDGRSEYYEHAVVHDSPNVVLINVSPIEYGHVLLVPRVMDCIPQRLDPDTLLLALHMCLEADNPFLRLGYNSLGAFATINHLHFQAYYLNTLFPIERAPTVRIAHKKRKRTVKVSELRQFPVRGLVFEVGNSLEELAMAVGKACVRLQDNNMPYNVLIADRGARVFVLPQCFAERQAKGEVESHVLDTQVNPAVWEISGHIVLKRREDYDKADEAWAWRLLSEVSLSEEQFNEVKKLCLEEVEKVGEEEQVQVIPTNFDETFGLGLGHPPVVKDIQWTDEAGRSLASAVLEEAGEDALVPDVSKGKAALLGDEMVVPEMQQF